MLVAVLNCCSKEELDELEEEPVVPAAPGTPAADEVAERRKAIKSKIMAVGRMSRVFALLRLVLADVHNARARLIHV
jgi:serine/threonine-protein phosphatase 2B catalytic subunit